MKASPQVEIVTGRAPICQLVRGNVFSIGESRPDAERARQVNQFATHLRSGEVEEVPRILGTHLSEGIEHPYRRPLDHIGGLGVWADIWKRPEHSPRHALELATYGPEQLVGRLPVAGPEAVDAISDLDAAIVVHPQGSRWCVPLYQ
jgi:hypothetical protein